MEQPRIDKGPRVSASAPVHTAYSAFDPFLLFLPHAEWCLNNIKHNRFFPVVVVDVFMFIDIGPTRNCWKMVSSANLTFLFVLDLWSSQYFPFFVAMVFNSRFMSYSNRTLLLNHSLNVHNLTSRFINCLIKFFEPTTNLESFTCEEEIMFDEIYAVMMRVNDERLRNLLQNWRSHRV